MSRRSGGAAAADVPDIWTIAEADSELQDNDTNSGDCTVIVVGDSGCGKSTLIQTFLKPSVNKEPKPTFALEYSFARKKSAGGSSSAAGGPPSKSVAQIWELGGDIYEPKLLEIPLTQRTLGSAAVIVVCDLSKPQNAFSSLHRWVTLVKEVIAKRVSELGGRGGAVSSIRAENGSFLTLRDLASVPFIDHDDASRVRPCEIPLYFVANKFDALRKAASADRRTAMQALRWVECR